MGRASASSLRAQLAPRRTRAAGTAKDPPGALTCRQSCEESIDCLAGFCVGGRIPDELACYTDCTFDPSRCVDGETCELAIDDASGRSFCRPESY